ncbi:unnamed protein product, partial [Echinostoma caproni]|uniref:CA domain-containing protein n=1 Tax=Echinostoma caproni TaxID=27848 RepID=A0A183AF38_9TREM
ISIIDVNDNAPQFNQPEYTFHIAENQPRSTQIGQITATDLDSEIHGPITYFLSTDRDALAFRLDRETGVLRSRQPLDREEQARYVFRVLARDGSPSTASVTGTRSAERSVPVGTVQLTGTATVTVMVDDVNDNWPVFISPNATANTLAIAIDETLGHKLAYIQAEDADQDENGLISYHIRSGNTQRLFGLDSATGLLYLAGNLGQPSTGTPQEASTERNDTIDTPEWPTHLYKPSFHVLTLEACDHGRTPKPHCTLFSNLKIIIKDQKEEGFDASTRRAQVASLLDTSASKDSSAGTLSMGFDGRINRPEALPYGDHASLANSQHVRHPRHNASEIVIICLSIVFTVVLMATLLLICLLRKRSTHYLNQKKILTENSREPREHNWNEACSSAQLAVDSEPGLKPEQDAVDSLINSQLPETKSNDHDLSTYPRSVDTIQEGSNFVPVSLSKEQYHLLTRTVDTRRRNLPCEFQSHETPLNMDPPLLSGDNRFPTVAGAAGRVQQRTQTNKPPRTNDYQTLDYLGLVSTAIPQRYPHLYATQRRLTYSPLGPTPMRMYHGGVFTGNRPPKADSILLTHMNQLATTGTRSPLPDYKGSDPNYLINHSHSRSQPQPMDRRSVVYPFVGSPTLSNQVQQNLAPLINRPIRPGLRTFQQVATYQSIVNSNTNMNTSTGSVSTALYGSRSSGYPIQSHTYYDIRQPDQQDNFNLLPKSKSQQIPRHNSKPSPLTTDVIDDDISVEQTQNCIGDITSPSVGTEQTCNSVIKNDDDANGTSWRDPNTRKDTSEWTKYQGQPEASSTSNVTRFLSSPLDSPKYVAAAYKEASFV